jgi:uncharacterized protein with PCYCGC motif
MRGRRKKQEQDWAGLIMIIIFGVATLALVSVIFYSSHRVAVMDQARRAAVPPFFASVAEAQPLPITLEPDQSQEPKIQSAYAMARQKPAILAQQPCYCSCNRLGHRRLLDCLRSEHAAKCSICIRESNYARELDAGGKCAVDIRNKIIRTDWKSLGEANAVMDFFVVRTGSCGGALKLRAQVLPKV